MASQLPGVEASSRQPRPAEWIARFAFGILAGAVAFGLVYSTNPLFSVPEEYHIKGLGESNERWAAFLAQQRSADRKNAAFFIGSLGALLALAVSISSKSQSSMAKRLMVRVPIGAVSGAIAGVASAQLQAYFNSLGQIELGQSAAIYATMFGLLGAGIGIGIGLTTGTPLKAKAVAERIGVGLVSGALAGAVYPIACSLLAPATNIEAILPRSAATQAIWLALATGVLGVTLPAPRATTEASIA